MSRPCRQEFWCYHRTQFTNSSRSLAVIMLSFIISSATTFVRTNAISAANKCAASRQTNARKAFTTTMRSTGNTNPPSSGSGLNARSNGQSNDQSNDQSNTSTTTARNVLGGPIELCCNSPRTGFYRDGHCNTGPDDFGVHTVCCRVTTEFLEFSRSHGNDLITPAPQYGFPGLTEGDGWCLCASRWKEAALAGYACPIVLASTHENTLRTVPMDLLIQHAIDRDDVPAGTDAPTSSTQ